MAVADAARSDVGIIGMDGIGRNAALRLAEHPFNVAVYDWHSSKTLAFQEQTTETSVRVAASISDLTASLRQPRTFLIFSGPDAPMSFVLDQLLPELEEGDLVMDAGDSYFKETARHQSLLAEQRVQFMGIGLAGGQSGARHGAIVMAGGPLEACHQSRRLLEAMAATVAGQPCVCCFDSAAAAHFVKMVHAGIESALLQLLSETHDILQRCLQLSDEAWHDAPGARDIGVLNEYLMEISGRVFESADIQTMRLFLEERLAALGTWVAQTAGELGVLIPTLEAALETQHAPAIQRRQALLAAPFRQPVGSMGNDPNSVLDALRGALHAAMMIAYAQGFALLIAASKHFDFQFDLREISRAWRGRAPLRALLLDAISAAFQATPDLPDLLTDDDLSESVMALQENLRQAVWRAHELDTLVPAFLASLDYLDSDRAAWLPVNLIQTPPRLPAGRSLEMAAY
jgi:6-phosphogluconate dehydrogenase